MKSISRARGLSKAYALTETADGAMFKKRVTQLENEHRKSEHWTILLTHFIMPTCRSKKKIERSAQLEVKINTVYNLLMYNSPATQGVFSTS